MEEGLSSGCSTRRRWKEGIVAMENVEREGTELEMDEVDEREEDAVLEEEELNGMWVGGGCGDKSASEHERMALTRWR